MRSARRMRRIEQPVKMDHKVAHQRVVDRFLRRRLPRRVSFGIIRVDTDDIEMFEIAEGDALKRFEFAAKNEVQQLLRRLGGFGHAGLVPGLRRGAGR